MRGIFIIIIGLLLLSALLSLQLPDDVFVLLLHGLDETLLDQLFIVSSVVSFFIADHADVLVVHAINAFPGILLLASGRIWGLFNHSPISQQVN